MFNVRLALLLIKVTYLIPYFWSFLRHHVIWSDVELNLYDAMSYDRYSA